MTFMPKQITHQLLLWVWTSKNMKKNLGQIGPFLEHANWPYKKTYLHYMSISQSCPILVFYSLKDAR